MSILLLFLFSCDSFRSSPAFSNRLSTNPARSIVSLMVFMPALFGSNLSRFACHDTLACLRLVFSGSLLQSSHSVHPSFGPQPVQFSFPLMVTRSPVFMQ